MFRDLTETAVHRSIMELENTNRLMDSEMMVKLKDLYGNLDAPVRNPDVSDRIYNGRLESWTPINYCALIVDKISSVLYGRPISRTSGNETLDKALSATYTSTKSSFVRVSKIASLGGYSALRLRRNWTGAIVLDTYGFDEVSPILNNEDPFGSPQGLIFCVQVNSLPDWAQSQVKNKSLYVFKEVITRNKRDEYGKIVEYGEYRAFVDGKEIRTPSNGLNPMGDFLGAVYWRGSEHPFNYWGKSDILGVLSMLEAINELFTDGRELMVWGIHSPIIALNCESGLDWKYSPRSVLQAAGEGATVSRLDGATQSFSDLKGFIELLVNESHQVTRVPSVAVGDLNGIGQASSGRAFEIAMIPFNELMHEKENTCISQEILLMQELIAKKAYYGDIKGYTKNLGGIYMPDAEKILKDTQDINIEFAPIKSPESPITDSLTSQVAGGLRSRFNAVKTLHPTWNTEQIEEELTRIDKDNMGGTDALSTNMVDEMKKKLGR